MGPLRIGARQAVVLASVLIGATGMALALGDPAGVAPLVWFGPASSFGIGTVLVVTAVIGLSDSSVRADRRALPLAAAGVALAVLWWSTLGAASPTGMASSPGRLQVARAVFDMAHLATAVLLLVATAATRRGRLNNPAAAIVGTVTTALGGSGALVAVTYLVAPHLPALVSGGRYTAFDHVVSIAAIVPLLLAIAVHRRGRRGDDRVHAAVVGALVLLAFESVGTLGLSVRFTAGWYALAALRLGAFALLVGGELRLYAMAARAERRRAADLAVLADAARRIGASLDPVAVGAELAAMVTGVVERTTGAPPVVKVFHVDGPMVSRLTESDVRGSAAAPSFQLSTHPIMAEAVATGRVACGRPVGALVAEQVVGPEDAPAQPIRSLAVVPITGQGVVLGAMEIAHTAAGARWQSPHDLALLSGLAATAGLALAHAEAFDDLQNAEDQNRAILSAIHDAYISVTLDGAVVGWNDKASDLLGWAARDVVGRNIVELIGPPDERAAYSGYLERFGGSRRSTPVGFSQELTARTRAGAELPVELDGWRVDSGGSSRLCMLVRDISERKATEAKLRRRATHDSLTELPNRALIMEYLTRALHTGNTGDERVAVIFVDLNGFKAVNDTWGHEAGDRLLAAVAYRLVSAVRPGDVVGRFGGDEFVVVCRGVRDPVEADMVAARLHRVLSDPVALLEGDARVSASVGLAISEPDSTPRDLIRRADAAMYLNKGRREEALTRVE